jgi:hypothetical protein
VTEFAAALGHIGRHCFTLSQEGARDVGLSKNSDVFVGALDHGCNDNGVCERSRTGNFGSGAAWACCVSDKMP